MRQLAEVAAILEIQRKPDGEIPAALISAAYRASQFRPVMLVLGAVSPGEVDRVLDPVVARNGRHHRGVVYVNTSDATVLNAAAGNSLVFATSDEFRSKLASHGIAFRDVSEAEPELNHVGSKD